MSNGNLTAQETGNLRRSVRATDSKSSGKWYWEITVDEPGLYDLVTVGIGTSSMSLSSTPGRVDAYGYGFEYLGKTWYNTASISCGVTFAPGDIISVAVDLDNGKTFEIEAHNASVENKYIQSAMLNGEKLDKPWITHEAITNGGKLVFEMGPKANKSWGIE